MLSQQAIILGICNLVIFVAVVISMFVLKKDADKGAGAVGKGGKVVAVLKNVAALVLFLVIMVLQIYSLNCMVYGDCVAWSWILTALAVFGTLGYLGVFAYIAMSTRKISGEIKDMVKPIVEADRIGLAEKGVVA